MSQQQQDTAAVAGAAYVASSEMASEDSSSHSMSMLLNANNNSNKWAKNGFGDPCPRSGGKFTREETELVRRAVEEYCALKNISTARLCSECDHKAELKGAWMEIAKRLPHRTVQSVYRHGLRQLHPFKRGPWTEPECQALLELVTRMGKKWSTIQSKLHRSADSCRDKYREMSTEYVKGRWKEAETEILKRLIREHLQADPSADMKDLGKMVEREGIIIPWSVISKRMGKRSRLSCFKKWQKMTGLFSASDQQKSGAVGVGVAPPPPAATTDAAVKPAASTAAAQISSAPTAGAAAAAAAKAVANPMSATSTAASATEVVREYDIYLLQLLVTSGAVRNEQVDWTSFRLSGDPQARWNTLLDEWQEESNDSDALLDLPLCDIAKVMLEHKTKEGDAKMAAETVEAVDLPPVPVTRADEKQQETKEV